MWYQSLFRTTVAISVNPGDTTIEVATAPTVTKWRMLLRAGNTRELIEYNGVSWTTLQNVVRSLSLTADPATSTGSWETWIAGTQIILVEMHDQKSDKQEGSPVRVYADEAARDAAITSPVNGMSCYVTSLWVFTDYITGAWTQRATGSTPNASETVAGKVEIATQAEFDAGTDTWGTGAFNVVRPSQIKAKDDDLQTQINNIDSFELPYGEDLTAWNSVFVNFIPPVSDFAWLLLNFWNTTNEKRAIRIVGNGVSVSDIDVRLAKRMSPTDNLVIRIETDNSGEPSGTLADPNSSGTIAGSGLSGTPTLETVSFTGSFSLTDQTVYWIVFERSGSLDNTNNYDLNRIDVFTTFKLRQFDGVSWADTGSTITAHFDFDGNYKGQLAKTDADTSIALFFVWFVETTGLAGTFGRVNHSLVNGNQSNLEVWEVYYLSDTAGEISTTIGTNKVKVWIALSEEQILIQPQIDDSLL